MKWYCVFSVGAAAAAVALGSAFGADDELPDHKVTEWRIGEIVSGDSTLKLDKLEGKVVAIEYWGVN